MRLRQDEWLAAGGQRARFAVTDRRDGVSRAPYDGANLGAHVGDDPGDVATNRAALAAEVGLAPDRLAFMAQVHGNTVHQVGGAEGAPGTGATPEADALVTTATDVALVVLVADCIPVLIADPAAGVVGVAHAGRPGLASGVVPRLVAAMRDLGARDLTARLGPSVCPRCYEVPETMRAEVAEIAPLAASIDRHGRPALDLAAGVLAQLAALGAAVEQWPGCTRETPSLYSYRREGLTGRFAGLALLSSSER